MASWLISGLVLVLAVCSAGCARCLNSVSRPFDQGRDSFAFQNELLHRYVLDVDGDMSSHRVEPTPDYTLHCFPMVRAAREFFYHARFDSALPRVSSSEYQTLIQKVVGRDSRCLSTEPDKIVIPGFESLVDFSREHEPLLKKGCGAKWNSYTQRGNWRMVLPFPRRHQAQTAGTLISKLDSGLLPIVHIVDFPGLQINHAILLTGWEGDGDQLVFAVDRSQQLRTLGAPPF